MHGTSRRTLMAGARNLIIEGNYQAYLQRCLLNPCSSQTQTFLNPVPDHQLYLKDFYCTLDVASHSLEPANNRADSTSSLRRRVLQRPMCSLPTRKPIGSTWRD